MSIKKLEDIDHKLEILNRRTLAQWAFIVSLAEKVYGVNTLDVLDEYQRIGETAKAAINEHDETEWLKRLLER